MPYMNTPVHNFLCDWLRDLYLNNHARFECTNGPLCTENPDHLCHSCIYHNVEGSAYLTAICEDGTLDVLKDAIAHQITMTPAMRLVEAYREMDVSVKMINAGVSILEEIGIAWPYNRNAIVIEIYQVMKRAQLSEQSTPEALT